MPFLSAIVTRSPTASSAAAAAVTSSSSAAGVLLIAISGQVTSPTAVVALSAAASSASGAAASAPRRRSRSGDVDGFGTAVVGVVDGELDVVALGERSESVGADTSLVDEEILAAFLRRYEPEPFLRAEPLRRPFVPLHLRH